MKNAWLNVRLRDALPVVWPATRRGPAGETYLRSSETGKGGSGGFAKAAKTAQRSCILILVSIVLVIGDVRAQSSSPQVSHFEYVLPDQTIYVYDIDNQFALVKQISLPIAKAIRGVVASPKTHMLYISYGGNGGPASGNGSMLEYDLLTDTVVWTKDYTTGVDSMAITPDGKTIYLPTGELNPNGIWDVVDADTGDVLSTIDAGSGPHNTVMSVDGTNVYLGGRFALYLEVASTATNTVTQRIGPLVSTVRPFTINGKQTLAFTTGTTFLGFQVSDITSGAVLYTVPIAGFNCGSACAPPGAPSHGISLSPDEKEVYVIDSPNSYVHVFDVSGLPGSAPVQVADIPLTRPMTGFESPCPFDCSREGWVQHSRDGRFVFVGDSGDVIDIATRRSVVNLDPLYNTRKFLEIDWENGLPVSTTSRHGLGYVILHPAALSGTSLTFGSQGVETTSAPQVLTLANNGASVLVVGSITSNGDFAQSNSCGASIPGGTDCTISVTFTPTVTGPRAGFITITDNDASSPQTVTLNGVGSDFLTSASPASNTIHSGEPASYTLTLSPEEGFEQTVALSCAGAPELATCSILPASLTLDGTHSATAIVTVATTGPSIAVRRSPQAPPGRLSHSVRELPLLWLVLLALMQLATAAVAKRRRLRLGLGVSMLLLLLCPACGTSSSSRSPGTPAGTYTLTVTAASGGLSHQVTFTLNIN